MTYPTDVYAAHLTVRVAFEAPGWVAALHDADEIKRVLETAIGSIMNTTFCGRQRVDPVSPNAAQFWVQVGELEEYDDLGRRVFPHKPTRADLDALDGDDS